MKRLIPAIFVLSILVGCGISSTEAERTSREFIEANVKFYGVASNTSEAVATYDLILKEVLEFEGKWQVSYLVKAIMYNTTKEKNITVCLDSKGRATSFNAKNEPCP